MKLLKAIDKLNMWRRGNERAPHKPLLLLYALAEQVRNPEAKFEFSRVEEDLDALLNEFYKPLGGSRRHHVNDPFWRLRRDGIWVVEHDGEIRETSSSGGVAYVTDLRKYNATGLFSEDVVQEIKNNSEIVLQAARKLLDKHFPESLHQDILERVGLDYKTISSEEYLAKRTKRDGKFREKVLHTYEYSCAVCGFNLRMKTMPVGLEAAHIKWHQHGGPDMESNGLALCATHHKLLDSGVMTLSEDYRIILSDSIYDPDPENSFIKKHQNREIRLPRNRKHFPGMDYIHWHRMQVFREPELVLT